MRPAHFTLPVSALILALFTFGAPRALSSPLVYPPPQKLTAGPGAFVLRPGVCLLVAPGQSAAHDLFLARFLVAELANRWGATVEMLTVDAIPAGRPAIILGTRTGPLVKAALQRLKISIDSRAAGPEGYLLHASPDLVVVAGGDEAGAFYGLQSLRQLISASDGSLAVSGVHIEDWPYKPFRGIKLFLPGRDNLPFFRRFMRDFMALFKFNRLVLEMNAGMRLDRRPEVNTGWIEFADTMNYSRRDRPEGPGRQFQDSAHHDTADGKVLEKEEVAEIVRFAREHHIEIIPRFLPSPTATTC